MDAPDLTCATLAPVSDIAVLEHQGLAAVLAAAMPEVRHHKRSLRGFGDPQQTPADEHLLVDEASGSAVRILVSWSQPHTRTCYAAATAGPRDLLAELIRR
jgi:hypothetical protein